MTTSKMTNRIALEYCIKYINMDDSWCDKYDPNEVIAKLEKMIDQLDKKNAAPKKLTAKQTENEGVKADLLFFLSDHEGEGFTCSDLLKKVPVLEGKSNQYVSALMRQLVTDKAVEKFTDKRRTYFRAVTEVEG